MDMVLNTTLKGIFLWILRNFWINSLAHLWWLYCNSNQKEELIKLNRGYKTYFERLGGKAVAGECYTKKAFLKIVQTS